MFFNKAAAIWANAAAHFGDQARAAMLLLGNKHAPQFVHPRYSHNKRNYMKGWTQGYYPNGSRECERRAKRYNPNSANGF